MFTQFLRNILWSENFIFKRLFFLLIGFNLWLVSSYIVIITDELILFQLHLYLVYVLIFNRILKLRATFIWFLYIIIFLIQLLKKQLFRRFWILYILKFLNWALNSFLCQLMLILNRQKIWNFNFIVHLNIKIMLMLDHFLFYEFLSVIKSTFLEIIVK